MKNHDAGRIPLSRKQREQKQGEFPYYGASGIIDHVDDYIFDGDYVLLSEDGENLRTRKTPVSFLASGKFWVNNHAHILTGAHGVCLQHLLQFLHHVDIAPYLTGAVQPKLNQSNMNRIPFILPPPSVCEAFSLLVHPSTMSHRANVEESRKLATLRDYLLPKLLSGEVRVADAAKITGRAG